MSPPKKTLVESLNASTLQRYQLIEIISYWEGRLTTNHLQRAFDIGRQQASRAINSYLNEFAPDNLIYDDKMRGYIPSETFRPCFTQGRVDEYLNLLKINQNLISKNNHTALGMRAINSVTPPPRFIEPDIMRAINRAIAENLNLEVQYLSLENPEGETRIIAPHSLVESPLRWHVRAYCEKDNRYCDFVLSRFINKPVILGRSSNTMELDVEWCNTIEVVLQAEPQLSAPQKQLIERDYDMKNGELIIPTRLAMLNYMLSSLGLDITNDLPIPSFQKLSLKNIDEIKTTLTLISS